MICIDIASICSDLRNAHCRHRSQPFLRQIDTYARIWCGEFIDWYNDEHHHSGLNGHIPADLFHHRASRVTATKQAALDIAYQAHPERFVHGQPKAKAPPAMVEINPLPASIISLPTATRSHEVRGKNDHRVASKNTEN